MRRHSYIIFVVPESACMVSLKPQTNRQTKHRIYCRSYILYIEGLSKPLQIIQQCFQLDSSFNLCADFYGPENFLLPSLGDCSSTLHEHPLNTPLLFFVLNQAQLVSQFKCLSVLLTSDLSWSSHIKCSRVKKMLGILYRHAALKLY